MKRTLKYILVALTVILGRLLAFSEEPEPTDSIHNLDEVIVVAQENKGLSSSSKIDRDAMQHLQPTSFTDLLELIPGNISQDPDMSKANTITMRETGNITATGEKTSNEDYAISALGTQFIVDGAEINTDAGIRGIIGVDPSDPSSRRSSVNKGVDMRNLTTDDIESVEVVRGIPSAEYGNLTSGLVNIRRIKRSTPFTFRIKADEYSKLFSASKGFGFDKAFNTLNLHIGYLDSKSDPRNNLENYKRLTTSILPTFRFDNGNVAVNWNLGVDFTCTIDKSKKDPDLNHNKIDEFSNDYNRVSFTSELNMILYRPSFIDNIIINASASYENEETRRRKQVAPSRASIATSGYEAGDHNVSLLLGEYVADYRVYSQPFYSAVKVKGTGNRAWGNTMHHYKAGAEWSIAKNFGNGQEYDLQRPLSGSWTSRPRAFREIPALQQLSWYAEDQMNLSLGTGGIDVQAGIRCMTLPALDKKYRLAGKVHFDPRVNLLWNSPTINTKKPIQFQIAAGWGMTTRMPTLDYLFPQCQYQDIIQFNYYDTIDPMSNSLINVRTYKADATNYGLRAATNNKWEVRLGMSLGNNKLAVTYFEERMDNGFRYTPVYSSYDYRRYEGTLYDPTSHSVENLPSVDSKILEGYSRVTNGTSINKRGIEYTLQTERCKALKTSLIISGAWFRSYYSNSQVLYRPVNDVIGNQAVSDIYIGVYDTKDGRVNEQFNTNFLFDTQVPKFGLIFTTSIQCMWYVKTTRMRENGVPASYISAYDGELHPYDPADLSDPMLRYLVKTYNETAFNTFKVPAALYVNLKVSKKFGSHFRISAFVNRILDWLPDYNSNGLTVRRNSDAYFGMEAVITI